MSSSISRKLAFNTLCCAALAAACMVLPAGPAQAEMAVNGFFQADFVKAGVFGGNTAKSTRSKGGSYSWEPVRYSGQAYRSLRAGRTASAGQAAQSSPRRGYEGKFVKDKQGVGPHPTRPASEWDVSELIGAQ